MSLCNSFGYNLEGPSLLRVQQALPVVVIGLGAAVSFLLWRLSAAAVSGDSSPTCSGGEVLVALPRPVCLRRDVPFVSLATQWVGKKIFLIMSGSPILCGGFTHKYAQF